MELMHGMEKLIDEQKGKVKIIINIPDGLFNRPLLFVYNKPPHVGSQRTLGLSRDKRNENHIL